MGRPSDAERSRVQRWTHGSDGEPIVPYPQVDGDAYPFRASQRAVGAIAPPMRVTGLACKRAGRNTNSIKGLVSILDLSRRAGAAGMWRAPAHHEKSRLLSFAIRP